MSQRKFSISQKQQPTSNGLDGSARLSSIWKDIRGGAGSNYEHEYDDEENEDHGISMDASSSSMVLDKLRNIIRSVLKTGDKKAPSVSMMLRSVLQGLEGILGVELLPPKAESKSRRKSKKRSKKSKKAAVKDDDEQAESKSNDKATKQKKQVKVAKSAAKPSVATTKHLATKLTSKNPNYRIQKELKEFIKEPSPNLTVKVGKNIRIWIVTMVGADGTIYEGEVYKLRISFPPSYPTMPPSVYFLPPNIPKHEHVYTNGDICLSLLGKDWRPIMTAQSIAASILSILSSAQAKSIPMDNAKHAQNKPGQYQQDWIYHDDNC